MVGLAGRTLAGSLALLLASVAISAHADGLFLPLTAQDAPAMPWTSSGLGVQPRSSDPPAAWERHVRVARHYLASARDDAQYGETGRLVLNVRDGLRLEVVVERTAPTRWGYSLSGRVAGGGVGFVTLVVHEEAVAGSIWTPESAYELKHLGGGIHALRDVTNAPPVECGGALPPQLSATKATTQGGTDDGSVVDILVVWTPRVEGQAGGEPLVLAQIDQHIAYTNDAFDRSGASVTLSLVGTEKVDDHSTDIGMTDILRRLQDPDDGYMDRVHDRRDTLGADLVYLLLARLSDFPGIGGVGSLRGAFSVGLHDDSFVFAHEVGHNFGIAHERREYDLNRHRPRPQPPNGYAHGFTTENCTVTIMSYGGECPNMVRGWLPFYASPWRYDPGSGLALGVSRLSDVRGFRGPADAVRALNRNRHRVANFRPSRSRSTR